MNLKKQIEEGFNILETITECNWPNNKRITREKLIASLAQLEKAPYEFLDYKGSDGLSKVFIRSINNYINLKGNIKSHRQFILSITDTFMCRECKEILNLKVKMNNEYLCKQCGLNELNNKVNEVKNYIYEYYIAHNCIDCGESNPIVLEFDHRDTTTKEFNISRMSLQPLYKVKKEIEKCDVVCANCHKIRTAKQQKWYDKI